MTRPPASRDHAARWLARFMRRRGGVARIDHVYAAAERAGISERTLRRARLDVGVSRVPGQHVWRMEEDQ